MNKPNRLSARQVGNAIYKHSLIIEVIIVLVLFQILTDGIFMSTRNLSNLMMQGATCSLIAVTMMLVIVSCNSDLSAGAVLGCIGTITATMQVNLSMGTGLSIIASLAVGVVIGLWHGYWIAYKKLPAFIVTYGTQLVVKGITLLVGGGYAVGPVNDSFAWIGKDYLPSLFFKDAAFNDTSLILTVVLIAVYVVMSITSEKKRIAQGVIEPNWGKTGLKIAGTSILVFAVASIFIFYKGFPYAILLLLIVAAAVAYVVQNTQFGRYVFAIGGNAEAARMSGINNEKVIMQIYVLHSVVVSLASMVYLGRVGQATATAGTSFEFTAITGCVVGGTSIVGGRGNVVGAVIGTMLMAALDNGMSLLNMGQHAQYIVKGMVLMLAIAMDVISRNKKG